MKFLIFTALFLTGICHAEFIDKEDKLKYYLQDEIVYLTNQMMRLTIDDSNYMTNPQWNYLKGKYDAYNDILINFH